MVAAGSGSCKEGNCSGGGLVAYVASDYNNGGAGSQTNGGTATSSAINGGFVYGGNGFVSDPQNPYNNVGYGGGGGYYGGGGGKGGTVNSPNNRNGSGGGGSSFISGHIGCIAIQSEDKIMPKAECNDATITKQ